MHTLRSTLRSLAGSVYWASSRFLESARGRVLILMYHRVIPRGEVHATFVQPGIYVTPETFHFELGLFFFICIVIGGRGAIIGPLLGTVVLTALPEVVAPLEASYCRRSTLRRRRSRSSVNSAVRSCTVSPVPFQTSLSRPAAR